MELILLESMKEIALIYIYLRLLRAPWLGLRAETLLDQHI
jgi:hypothetical protein